MQNGVTGKIIDGALSADGHMNGVTLPELPFDSVDEITFRTTEAVPCLDVEDLQCRGLARQLARFLASASTLP
jgi:hypothetical protein